MLATNPPVMKNNDNASSDLEDGKAALFNSPSQDYTSTSRSLAATDMAKPKFKYLSWIFRRFDLTKTTTQQKALLLLRVAGAIIDPLFFYIPMINEGSKCMKSDRKLGAIAISLRSLVDVLPFMLWWWCYSEKRKAKRLKPGDANAAGTLKENSSGNPNSMSPRNSKATSCLIEILSNIPLPQAVTLAILIIQGSPRSQQAVTLLKFSVLSQFVIRIFWVFPAFQEATSNSFMLLKSRFWIGAGFNLLLFVIASHVLGAFWYLLSVGRMMDCWKSACRRQVGCNIDSLYCGGPMDNKSYLDHYCPIQPLTNSSTFNFGIYLVALDSNIVGSTRFSLKLSYCFWWGLRNLSSLGQNLTASPYEWEILFSICISVLGLILFSLFIGNMQAFFQYRTNKDLEKMTDKMDKIEKKGRELLKWEPFRWVPQELREEIIFCTNDCWLETTEVDLWAMINHLPEGLNKKFKDSIFSKMEKKVKLFRALEMRALNMINCVKPVVFAEGTLVFVKGQPIKYMVFVLNGKLTKQNGSDGSMDQDLQAWDFCGEELLLEIISSSLKPQPLKTALTWTADIKTCTKVEAFILDTSALQNLLNQFKNTNGMSFRVHKIVTEYKTKKQKKKADEKPVVDVVRSAARG